MFESKSATQAQSFRHTKLRIFELSKGKSESSLWLKHLRCFFQEELGYSLAYVKLTHAVIRGQWHLIQLLTFT